MIVTVNGKLDSQNDGLPRTLERQSKLMVWNATVHQATAAR